MADLSCLIAPRPLVIVSGRYDVGFPLEGVNETFSEVRKIYEKEGAPDNCRLIVGNEGHRFYKEPSWKVFSEMANW